MEKYPITATPASARSRKSVWTALATGSNRRMDASGLVSLGASAIGHLTASFLARILSHFTKLLRGHLCSAATLLALSRLRHAPVERAEARPRGEIHREHSYLCASCTCGQAIFLCIVSDDGFRPAGNQHKQTGDGDRSYSATRGVV